MIFYKNILVINEGIVFGLFAIGIFISFKWLRFPDLTPDGSFAIGACIYVKLVTVGLSNIVAVLIAVLGGIFSGLITAFLYKIIKIPSVVSGLLVSVGLYSGAWILLGKPNQFLEPKYAFFGQTSGKTTAINMLAGFLIISLILVVILKIFSESIWGIKLRAIGENFRLARDIGANDTVYTCVGLGVANGIIALSGVLFVQRSFSADINMGVGQTVTGLIALIIGLLIARKRRNITYILISIVIGSIAHKYIVFLALEAGMPAESFRAVSTVLFIFLFFALRISGIDFLKGLKWS